MINQKSNPFIQCNSISLQTHNIIRYFQKIESVGEHFGSFVFRVEVNDVLAAGVLFRLPPADESFHRKQSDHIAFTYSGHAVALFEVGQHPPRRISHLAEHPVSRHVHNRHDFHIHSVDVQASPISVELLGYLSDEPAPFISQWIVQIVGNDFVDAHPLHVDLDVGWIMSQNLKVFIVSDF